MLLLRCVRQLTPSHKPGFWQKVLVALALIAVSFWALACYAEDNEEIPLNFDTQLIRIFEAVQTGLSIGPDHTISPPDSIDRKVLSRILDKLRNRQLMLKNVVYRTNTGVIRVTWADDANADVVKVAYKTGKDPVLGNSVYADKRQVSDVKIMYRTESNAYEYLHLENTDFRAHVTA